jgi:drug/metabolite transporter (DMT)-like permease
METLFARISASRSIKALGYCATRMAAHGEAKVLEPGEVCEIQEASEATKIAVTCAITTTVSVSMILINKALVLDIQFSGGLVLLQNAVTVLIVQVYDSCGCPRDLGRKSIRAHLLCAMLFGANTYTSMQALSFLSVTAFTIFRNTQSIVSYPLDYFMRGEKLKPVSIYLLFTILLGTCAFCGKGLRTNVEGIAWASAHVVSSTLYAVFIKMRIEAEGQAEPTPVGEDKGACAEGPHVSQICIEMEDVKQQSQLTRTLEIVWYNNLLSLPIVACAAGIQAARMPSSMLVRHAGALCLSLVALSCLGGCAMSIVGLKTQALLSPVTFLLFNNLNKIPATLISAVIWPHLETADTVQEIMGIVLSLIGGFLFALSKQGEVHFLALCAVTAISVAIVPLMVLGELADQRLSKTYFNISHIDNSADSSLHS